MGRIIIADKEFNFELLKAGRWLKQTPYFEAALNFCKDWLMGKEKFTLQTSGSTGTSKTIIVNRKQMQISARATGKFFDVKPGFNLLGCLNTDMIGGKMMLVRALEWEANLYLYEPSATPMKLIHENQKIDFAAMVPMQLSTSIDDYDSYKKLHQIANLIIGGAPLNPILQVKAAELPINIFQTFGMTETLSHVALARIDKKGDLIYKALPGVKFSQNSTGNLEIYSPMSDPNHITTNDLVNLHSEFSFSWKGRSDFTINSGGVKLQPEQIEHQLTKLINTLYPGRRYFIFGEADIRLGEKVCLVMEEKDRKEKKAEDLLSNSKALLTKYAVPKKIYFLENFEETASGKINRLATINKLKQKNE